GRRVVRRSEPVGEAPAADPSPELVAQASASASAGDMSLPWSTGEGLVLLVDVRWPGDTSSVAAARGRSAAGAGGGVGLAAQRGPRRGLVGCCGGVCRWV